MNLFFLRFVFTILTFYILIKFLTILSPLACLIKYVGYLFIVYLSCWISSSYFIGKFYAQKQVLSSKNKAVLITGCDSGFGLNLALQLANLDYCVFASCLNLNSDGAKKLIDLKNTTKKSIFLFELDVTSDESVNKCYDFVNKNIPEDQKLWALVNNAGIAFYSHSIWNENNLEEIHKKTFEVNVFGVIRMTNKFLPMLLENPDSRLVLLCSIAGVFTQCSLSSYCMSKHAIRSYGNSLRRDLNNKVRVILIEPSIYKTNISDGEMIIGELNKHWSRTSENMKKKITINKFNEALALSESFIKTSKTRIQDVIDVLLESICLKNPYYIYRACNNKERFAFYVLECLPDDIQDWFVDGFLHKLYLNISK